jgi:hypothetical protein
MNRSPQQKDRLLMDRLMGEVLPLDDLFSLISAGSNPQDNLDHSARVYPRQKITATLTDPLRLERPS